MCSSELCPGQRRVRDSSAMVPQSQAVLRTCCESWAGSDVAPPHCGHLFLPSLQLHSEFYSSSFPERFGVFRLHGEPGMPSAV